MTQARVFIVQVPARRDPGTGYWAPKYDISAAERFGRLVPVLPFGNVPKDPTACRTKLNEAFRDFDFASDCVLLLGDPVAIAHAVNILTTKMRGSKLRVLKWDRREGYYSVYEVG